MMDFHLCTEIAVSAALERDMYEPNEWDVDYFEVDVGKARLKVREGDQLWPILMSEIEARRDEVDMEWRSSVRRVRVLE